MSEKLKDVGLEKNAEALQDAAEAAQEHLREKIEHEAALAERGSEAVDKARHEALEKAISHEEERKKKTDAEEKAAKEKASRIKPHQRDLDASFKRTMSHIQKDMSPASRTFSKVIHNPVVDKVSSAVGSTVARPNLILAGAIGTLTLGLGFYIIAQHFGYVLSGSEAMIAFIAGWAIGAVVEFARVGFKNNAINK